MMVHTDSLRVNRGLSGWNNSAVKDFCFERYRMMFDEGIREVRDYRIEVGAVGVDTSQQVYLDQTPFPAVPVNFTLKDLHTNERILFGFIEIDGSGGYLTAGEYSDWVVLLTRVTPDSLFPTWILSLRPDALRRNPIPGDTLKIRVNGPFRPGDSYRFEAIAGGLLGVKPTVPMEYSLSQNYPNPFNPQTTIRFALGSPGLVSLEIYDILGRRVRLLLNEKLDAGDHIIRWDGLTDRGVSVASGVYFYRMNAAAFLQAKKMLLLR
jgi:hypothetical protein